MTSLKHNMIKNLVSAWVTFLCLIVLIVIESKLESPWVQITNALWIIGAILLVVFMGKGFNYLIKYMRSK